jgi:polysaccharide deacetylase 2 family uncharacterized protein YibQ
MARTLGNSVSAKAFIQGLFFGLFLILLLAAWLWLRAPAFMSAQQARLANVTVPVETSGMMTLEQSAATPASSPATGLDKKPVPPAQPVPPAAPVLVSLPPAPIDGLYESTPAGHLPQIDAKSGRTPFTAYSRPFTAADANGKPTISLVITDLGVSQSAAQAALNSLPPSVTFALSPYAESPGVLASQARAKGHEIWMILPLQPPDYPRADPGPHTMLIGAPQQENLSKLNWLMTRADGYAGFLAPAPSPFLTAPDAKAILDAMAARGLGFADGTNTVSPKDTKAPLIHADLSLDRDSDPADITAKLTALEDTARKNGHATVLLPPLPLVFKAVKSWTDSLPQKGFVLAPLSAQAAQAAH